MNDKPLVTVLMTVYNAAPFLPESIESILWQSYPHFEFIIVDDASQDQGLSIIKSYAQSDKRIQVISQATRAYATQASNLGLEIAQGKYILRMDADDISFSNRLAKLVAFMETNTQIDVCGSWAYAFKGHVSDEDSYQLYKRPTQSEQLILELYFRGGLGSLMHPTTIIRKATLDRFNFRYDPTYVIAGDRELWYQMSFQGTFANLGEPLLYYRLHPYQNTVQKANRVLEANHQTVRKYLHTWMPQANSSELALHADWQFHTYTPDKTFLSQIETWFLKVYEYNQKQLFFNPELLKKKLGQEWFILLNEATHLQMYPLKKYIQSPLSKMYPIGFQNLKRFTLDCLWKQPSRYLNKNIIH